LTNAEIVEHYNINTQPFKNFSLSTASSLDACAAAAEIYECGEKKAPVIKNAIQDNLKNAAAAAPVGVRQKF